MTGTTNYLRCLVVAFGAVFPVQMVDVIIGGVYGSPAS